MRTPTPWLLMAVCLFATACAHKTAEKPAPRAANPYSTFATAVSAIGGGEIDQILALYDENNRAKMADFLRTLYARYGEVQQLHAIAFDQEAQVARGVFLAAHRNGPFLWDMVVDGESYTMVRGSNDFSAFLQPIAPSPTALKLTQTSIDQLNRGDSTAVYANLICNCIGPAVFDSQVADLAQRAGAEISRELIRAETLPGLEDQLQIIHFLSKREGMHLGYHFTLWKVENQWRINAVNWTQEELLPQPLKNLSLR